MLNSTGRKTERAYWEGVAGNPIKSRLPSRLNVDVLNVTRLLKKIVRPGCRYLEIGCAPGKMLAWVAGKLKADVTGLDYSEPGIAKCRTLFADLGLMADLHHEDFFSHSLPAAVFDVVTSFGVIEHFDNPRSIVSRHLDLIKPGGMALIAIPNYGGIYGSLQRWFDPANLALHNLEIMNPCALKILADSPDISSVFTYPFGVISPWLINFEKRLPRIMSRSVCLGINVLGLLQPLTIAAIAPLLILEVHKGPIK